MEIPLTMISPTAWYPPAESRIPFAALFKSVKADLNAARGSMRDLTGYREVLFGPSGRVLLYALLCELRARAEAERSEVLIPGYTCYSVAAAIVKAGLKLRFYDLQAHTLAPVSASIERHCGPRTLAVISQHLLGIPTDTNIITAAARKQGAYHILDAAQNLGKSLKLSNADFVLFSFGRGKPLPLGAGGALVSDRFALDGMLPGFAEAFDLKRLVLTGITRLAADPFLYGIAEALPLGLGRTIFDPSFSIGKIPAGTIGLLPWMKRHFVALNTHRRKIAGIYRAGIDCERQVAVLPLHDPIYPRFPVLARDGELQRDLRRMGVRRLYPATLNREPRINAFAADGGQHLPGAEKLARKLVTLPTHLGIDTRTAGSIADALNRWIAHETDIDR